MKGTYYKTPPLVRACSSCLLKTENFIIMIKEYFLLFLSPHN